MIIAEMKRFYRHNSHLVLHVCIDATKAKPLCSLSYKHLAKQMKYSV